MDRKFFSAAAIVVGGFALAGSATAAVTLNTSGLKANSTLTLSKTALDLAAKNGMSYSAGGNATGSGGTFALPVTQAVLNVGLFTPTTPVSGKSIGSAVVITKGSGSNAKRVGLANFSVDYNTHQISGDVVFGEKSTNMGLFTFKEQSPLKISLKGLSLTMNQTIGNLTLTSAANTAIGASLGLSASATSSFSAVNFGTVVIDITTAKRSGKLAIGTRAFGPADMIPEPSTYALMGLGLVGIGFVARRKAQA